jgi:hypothetical protein
VVARTASLTGSTPLPRQRPWASAGFRWWRRERHRVKAQGIPLPLRALPRLVEDEERGCTGRETRRRGRMGKERWR